MRVPLPRPVAVADMLELLGRDSSACLGESDRRVDAAVDLAAPDGADAFTFVNGLDDRVLQQAVETEAGVVLARPPLAQRIREARGDVTVVAVENPRLAFIRLLNRLSPAAPREAGIAASAEVAPSASIGADVRIGETVVIGDDCRIGDGTAIDAGCILYPGTWIGRTCEIQAGVVIGAPGYGFERDTDDRLHRFPHPGRVVVEDDVEIGARSCIDRGNLDDTLIGRGTKIDDGAYVAHNVRIGRDCLIMAHVVLCGSCRIGDAVEISPSAVVRDHLSIGDRARIGLGAVVVKDIPSGDLVAGVPARPLRR